MRWVVGYSGSWSRVARGLAGLLAGLCLAACGGGGEPPSGGARAGAAGAEVSAGLVTLDGHAPSTRAAAVDAATQARVADDSLALGAAAALESGFAVPPLQVAQLALLHAAAGDSLRPRLEALLPSLTDAAWVGAQTAVLQRTVSATAGAAFRREFLDASTAVASWKVGQTLQDDRKLTMLRDELKASWRWPAASEAFDGVFVLDNGQRLAVGLVRVDEGVQRVSGSDFRADAWVGPQGTLVQLQPLAGPLAGWSQGRLHAALVQTRQALSAGRLAPGEILLPRGHYGASSNQQSWPQSLAAALDPRQADLRGLDGGGSYVKAATLWAGVDIGAEQLLFNGWQWLTLEFDASNRWSGTSSAGAVLTLISASDSCPHAHADLRSFYLAQLDAHGALVWLLAFTSGSSGAEVCVVRE